MVRLYDFMNKRKPLFDYNKIPSFSGNVQTGQCLSLNDCGTLACVYMRIERDKLHNSEQIQTIKQRIRDILEPICDVLIETDRGYYTLALQGNEPFGRKLYGRIGDIAVDIIGSQSSYPVILPGSYVKDINNRDFKYQGVNCSGNTPITKQLNQILEHINVDVPTNRATTRRNRRNIRELNNQTRHIFHDRISGFLGTSNVNGQTVLHRIILEYCLYMLARTSANISLEQLENDRDIEHTVNEYSHILKQILSRYNPNA